MVYYLPILGAIALAVGTIFERIVLRRKRVDIKTYQIASFLAIVIFLLPLIFFFWHVEPGALKLENILIFMLVIFFSTVANLVVFYSLKWEKVGNLEPARVLEPMFIILLALIFSLFTDGLYAKNPKVIIPAIVASLALVFSHIEKHHLKFNKYFIAAVCGSFLFALELVISRLILDFYSPITFYFIRSSSIFLISLLIFRPDYKELEAKTGWIIFLTGVIWVIYRIIIYYGYINLGVISTTLILMLGPIFIYTLAYFFLKEKISWKNLIAAAVVVASIIYALF